MQAMEEACDQSDGCDSGMSRREDVACDFCVLCFVSISLFSVNVSAVHMLLVRLKNKKMDVYLQKHSTVF